MSSADVRRPDGQVPTFAIVGAGRSGTTGLVEGLRRHPQVFVTNPKEPHYFAFHGARPDFRGPGDDRFVNDVAVTAPSDYRALYRSAVDHQARGEGSVSTLYYHERALPELRRINPDMRLVVLLRDPVERAFSSFQYLRASGREPLEDFLQAVAAEPSRLAENWHHLWHYTGMSMYAAALEAVLSSIPAEQVGVWFYDDLQTDYAGTLGSVLRFLDVRDVDNAATTDVPRVNASGVARHPWAQDALVWAAGRPVLRHTVQQLTSWKFRESVRTRLLQRGDVPTSVRAELQPLFEGDLGRLRTLLGDRADVPPWLAGDHGVAADGQEGSQPMSRPSRS